MNFNKFLQSLFGNKSSRDMKLIQPLVEEVKKAYTEIKALSNDELRARTKQLQQYVQDSAKEQKAKIEELKAKIEDTPIDERETIFNAIDKLEKEGHGTPLCRERRDRCDSHRLRPRTGFKSKERLRDNRRRQSLLPQPLDSRRQRPEMGNGTLRRAALRRYRIASRQDCRNGYR